MKKRLSEGTLKEYTKSQNSLNFSLTVKPKNSDFDRNGDVYRSESEQHKQLPSKVHMRKQRLFKLVHTSEYAIMHWFQLPWIILDIQQK